MVSTKTKIINVANEIGECFCLKKKGLKKKETKRNELLLWENKDEWFKIETW